MTATRHTTITLHCDAHRLGADECTAVHLYEADQAPLTVARRRAADDAETAGWLADVYGGLDLCPDHKELAE